MRSYFAEAARRGANALVQSLGSAQVVLRMAAPPAAGDAGEELGLRTPEFQPRTLMPVAVRRKAKTAEIVVAAETLETLLGLTGSGAVESAMRSVSTVQLGDEAYVLTGTEAVVAMGRACLYRLVLRLPATEEV
jgi:hypothetical protein